MEFALPAHSNVSKVKANLAGESSFLTVETEQVDKRQRRIIYQLFHGFCTHRSHRKIILRSGTVCSFS